MNTIRSIGADGRSGTRLFVFDMSDVDVYDDTRGHIYSGGLSAQVTVVVPM